MTRIHSFRCQQNRVEAQVQMGRRTYRIWFQLPWVGTIHPATAYLALALMPAMRLGKPLVVEGPVYPRLLENLPALMQLYNQWDKRLQPIQVTAQGVWEPPDAPQERLRWAAFSGGVDSFYTVYKQKPQLHGLLFVHGMDIKLTNRGLRQNVLGRLRQAAGELGLPLFEVESNLRQLTDPYCSWFLAAGTAFAAIGWLLAPRLSVLYLASWARYSENLADASHPAQNRLLSSDCFQFVSDGGEASRFQKLEFLAHDPLFQKNVRVCWENLGNAYNCGYCEKCLRTMVSLEILGVLKDVSTFPMPLSYRRLLSIISYSEEMYTYYMKENLEAALRYHADPRLIAALKRALTPAMMSRKRWLRMLLPLRLRRWLHAWRRYQ